MEYVKQLWKIVNWGDVVRRFDNATKKKESSWFMNKYFIIIKIFLSDVNCSWKFLYLIQQMVSSFQSCFIATIPLICRVSLNYSSNFINLTGKATGCNKLRELVINEILTNTKICCHWRNLNCFVRLKKLSIHFYSGFPGEIFSMGFKVRIFFYFFKDN